MKIVRFESVNGVIEFGVVKCENPAEAELISGDIFGEFELKGETAAIKKLLAPVEPPNIIAIGLNYRNHAEESGMAIPNHPLVFLKLTTSVIGPGDAIVLPNEAPDEVDYEAELAVVIGKRCKNITPEQSEDYILGYTCANDVSARDCQLKFDGQWARAKSFDTFCPLGPWIVTSDEFNPSDVEIKSIVSGETMQRSRTSELIFAVPELISYLSRQFTLLPGTVILTGTPPGVGFARKPARFLQAGDEVTVFIEGIGRLINPVISE